LKQSPGNSWVRYGATVAGFVDVTGTNRVLSLAISSLFADPIRGGTIPWNEQVVLGGTPLMRGFRPGRLVDRSAFIATLQYQWPIWVWLDGAMHVATGNVFGPELKGIDPKLFRLSSGIGLRTSNSPDTQFEALVGFGTDTFSEGTRISSFRLAIGATHGF
jgi:outer membrane protein assembly factor BamA